ncbi:hypothetical protein K8I85_08445, partial [bacterium]|nr:hypothetical protein [bacterium]
AMAAAAPPAPRIATVPAAALEAARRDDIAAALHRAVDCAGVDFEEAVPRTRAGIGDPANGDDNATHYARGNTLVVHVFIDHDAGTWSQGERDGAGAKAALAKEYYQNVAPPEANVLLDSGVSGIYAYYNAGVNYTIDTSMTWAPTEDALAAIGFTDDDNDGAIVDDATYSLMDWSGGFDGVIFAFQFADLQGRARASYTYSRCLQWTDDGASTWRHEFGHLFGSCDEYEEDGTCGNGQDCGDCQSDYLDQQYTNGNCEVGCGTSQPCIMINNVEDICSFTWSHWAWRDTDTNGQLDTVMRQRFPGSMVPIYELWEGGWALWDGGPASGGFVYHQKTSHWAVCGVRSPDGDDYDLKLFGDFNHEHVLTQSGLSVPIDFVVADYNHNNRGNEHVEVIHWSGPGNDYRLQYESGPEGLAPDGVVHVNTFQPEDVVRVFDVALFQGETVSIQLNVTGGGIDPGMAFFDSNGNDYFAGRGNALTISDANGAGGPESFFFTPPADDVYGLVVWNNTYEGGTFTLEIPWPGGELAEEVPETGLLAPGHYTYSPSGGQWSVVGAEATTGATNVDIKVYDDALATLRNASQMAPGFVDFVAVNYDLETVDPDWMRVERTMGFDAYRVEWEQSPDDLLAFTGPLAWDPGHLVKVWDLPGGTSMRFVRSYTTGFDDEMFIMQSADSSQGWRSRIQALAVSTSFPGSGQALDVDLAGGVGDEAVVIANGDGGSGTIDLWTGRRYHTSGDVSTNDPTGPVARFYHYLVENRHWAVFWTRPDDPAEQTMISAYSDPYFSPGNVLGTDQTGVGEMNYIMADYNHMIPDSVYVRSWRPAGDSYSRIWFRQGADSTIIAYAGAYLATPGTWEYGTRAIPYDLFLPGGQPVRISVLPRDGDLDYALALFQSSGGAYVGASEDAVAAADDNGPGGGESFDFLPPVDDFYGLVLMAHITVGSPHDYTIIVEPSPLVDVPSVPAPTELSFAVAPNPSSSSATFRLALPEAATASVDVFDAAGRRVRRVHDGPLPAGLHALVWDGRDDAGRNVGTGVYFARLRSPAGERSLKITRLQ